MLRLLESQAPAKQNATDTINTLSTRLQSATLLEDRRAAIQGLRSFAKLYPASVASGALRNLIITLSTDGEDVDTTKVVLETLLMLFNPDESSPEASDDIALWLADEFTQRQDNITTLLNLLDRQDFFSRLYSLQVIAAISTARLARTQECVYTAPLGVSRLVAVLDDKREAVRSEGLMLLITLTDSSPDLQKLVAFENAFDRIFNIINSEGSLTHGGVLVQDCLSLLANLLRLNASNQSFFRETGGVTKVAAILKEVINELNSAEGLAEWAVPQRDRNLWGLLSLIRLFVSGGISRTSVNQNSFWQHGVVTNILEIAFHPHMEAAIKAEALATCADAIRGNSSLQERFAQNNITLHVQVSGRSGAVGSPAVSGHSTQSTATTVNIIQGLLDITLAVSTVNPIDVRLAACECIKAYIFQHSQIRQHFLRRARDGYLSAEVEPDNILTILLADPVVDRSHDPYRIWNANVIFLNLIQDDHETKKLAMEISEGDASKGEEVVTCLQALAGNLMARTQQNDDDRISVGYLMVLIAWLFEDPDAVNDFLGEGSSVQSLIQLTLQSRPEKILVAGLCAFLLGIIYEFSTKDSPVPRTTIHELLANRLGREHFIDKMTRLREHPLIRDFEVLQQGALPEPLEGTLDVSLDRTFVDFLKDNFSRIMRAIDRAPGMEVPVIANGVQKGISRELVDSLKAQLEDRNQALQKLETELTTVARKLEQEQADHRKSKESFAIEHARITSINQSLHQNHEEDMQKTLKTHKREVEELQKQHGSYVSQQRVELERARALAESTAAKTASRHDAEVEDLKRTIANLEKAKTKADQDHARDLRTAHEEYSSTVGELKERLERAEEKAAEASMRTEQAQKLAAEKETARATVQTELDDLFMVLADLEEKRVQDKKQLKKLGQQVSDDENGDDDDDDDE